MEVAADSAVLIAGRVEVDEAQFGVLVPEPVRRQLAQRKVALAPRVDLAHVGGVLFEFAACFAQRRGSGLALPILPPENDVGMPDDQEQQAVQQDQDRRHPGDHFALGGVEML